MMRVGTQFTAVWKDGSLQDGFTLHSKGFNYYILSNGVRFYIVYKGCITLIHDYNASHKQIKMYKDAINMRALRTYRPTFIPTFTELHKEVLTGNIVHLKVVEGLNELNIKLEELRLSIRDMKLWQRVWMLFSGTALKYLKTKRLLRTTRKSYGVM